jgi:hypothetical protein
MHGIDGGSTAVLAEVHEPILTTRQMSANFS